MSALCSNDPICVQHAPGDRTIEVGLLGRDPALAATLLSHLQGLIDRELLRPLSGG